jgi:hypothetical protein
MTDEKKILGAIYEGTYDAWLNALGRNGLYPLTTETILKVIKEAVKEAVSERDVGK